MPREVWCPSIYFVCLSISQSTYGIIYTHGISWHIYVSGSQNIIHSSTVFLNSSLHLHLPSRHFFLDVFIFVAWTLKKNPNPDFLPTPENLYLPSEMVFSSTLKSYCLKEFVFLSKHFRLGHHFGWVVLASPGSLLEMQNLKPSPKTFWFTTFISVRSQVICLHIKAWQALLYFLFTLLASLILLGKNKWGPLPEAPKLG